MKFNFGHFWAKYQSYSLTVWPILADFPHFSICNQNRSNSLSVIFGGNTKAIALRFGQIWPIFTNFQSVIKILSKSPSVICGQNTKAIALLSGQNSLIFISFQSAFKTLMIVNFRHFWAKYQGYSLTFWPKLAHFSSLANLQSIICQSQFRSFLGKRPRL